MLLPLLTVCYNLLHFLEELITDMSTLILCQIYQSQPKTFTPLKYFVSTDLQATFYTFS